MNNIVLLVAAAAVLLGTLYPLALDALGLGTISVGPPYFNTVFVPLMLLLGLALGLGPLTRWKSHGGRELANRLRPVAFACAIFAMSAAIVLGQGKVIFTFLGLFVATWVLLSTALAVRERWAHQHTLKGMMRALSPGFSGMALAHLGFALTLAGVTVTSLYGAERDVKLAIGETAELGGYRFRMEGLRSVQGPNYDATEAEIAVLHGDSMIAELHPQKRIYRVQTSPMTEAAIDAGFTRDLYVALGEPIGKEAWSVRIQVKPCVRWIWLGGVVIALGGLLAASDRRYRFGPRPAPVRLTGATDPAV